MSACDACRRGFADELHEATRELTRRAQSAEIALGEARAEVESLRERVFWQDDAIAYGEKHCAALMEEREAWRAGVERLRAEVDRLRAEMRARAAT